jgi:hypothetical protein
MAAFAKSWRTYVSARMESFPGALKNGGGGKKKLSRGTTVSRDQSALCGKLTSILRTSRSRRQLVLFVPFSIKSCSLASTHR